MLWHFRTSRRSWSLHRRWPFDKILALCVEPQTSVLVAKVDLGRDNCGLFLSHVTTDAIGNVCLRLELLFSFLPATQIVRPT